MHIFLKKQLLKDHNYEVSEREYMNLVQRFR